MTNHKWKLERDEDFFRIYDTNKNIAGYFDPQYGDIFPQEKTAELIEQMHKNHDKIMGGYLMVPFVKFGIFDVTENMDITHIDLQIKSVTDRISKWKNFILKTNTKIHFIRVSHTDSDMLSITLPIKFEEPTPLEKNSILKQIEPILDSMQKQGLL